MGPWGFCGRSLQAAGVILACCSCRIDLIKELVFTISYLIWVIILLSTRRMECPVSSFKTVFQGASKSQNSVRFL